MEIQLVLNLPRDVASVPVSRQVLDSCLETLGVMPDTRSDIALALSEACANVVLHAGPGDEYEVQVSARNRKCTIEVVNTSDANGMPAAASPANGTVPDGAQTGGFSLSTDPVSPSAEHGRGLKIIDAVTDNLQLTGNGRRGTTVHFEKTLEWLPGAPGEQLLDADVPG